MADVKRVNELNINDIFKNEKIDKIKLEVLLDISEIVNHQSLHREVYEVPQSEVNIIKYFVIDRLADNMGYKYEIKEVPYSTEDNPIYVGDYITEYTSVVLKYHEHCVFLEDINEHILTIYVIKDKVTDRKKIINEIKTQLDKLSTDELLKIYARIK